MSVPCLIKPNFVVPLDEGARMMGLKAGHPVRLALERISYNLEAPTPEQAGCLR